MTIISEQGGNDHNNLAGWRLKSREDVIVIKEGGKVDGIKFSGWTNGIISFLQHYGQNW